MTTHHDHDHPRVPEDETAAAVLFHESRDRLREVLDLLSTATAQGFTYAADEYRHEVRDLSSLVVDILSAYSDAVMDDDSGEWVDRYAMLPDVVDDEGPESLLSLVPYRSVILLGGHRGWYLSADMVDEVSSLLGQDLPDDDVELLDAYREQRDAVMPTGETASHDDGEVSEWVQDLVREWEGHAADAGYVVEWDDGLMVYARSLVLPVDDEDETSSRDRGSVSLVVGAVLAAVLSVVGLCLPAQYVPPRVGGDTVPSGLVCQEDEVPGYAPTDSAPRSLRCVHVDEYRGQDR